MANLPDFCSFIKSQIIYP